MINIDDIEKIMKVVDKFNVSHFEFQQEDSKIVIDNNKISEGIINENSKVKDKVIEMKEEKNLNEVVEESKEETKEENLEKEYIKSTFAGTFYSSKENDGQAFVNLYDEVKDDTIVGLVEVMKLFNEVEAGVQGTIVDVLVKDGDFVEYGQPLFEIKTKN